MKFKKLAHSHRLHSTFPRLSQSPEKPLRIALYLGAGQTIKTVAKRIADFEVRQKKSGKLPFTLEIIDVSGLPNEEAFLEQVRQQSDDFDVFIFQMHASPTAATIMRAGKGLRSKHFGEHGIYLPGKTIVLSGCFTGCTHWPDYYRNSTRPDAPINAMIGKPVDPSKSLFHSAARSSGAAHVIGSIRLVSNSDFEAILEGLLGRLRGKAVQGFRRASRVSDQRPRLVDTSAGLNSLREGNTTQKLQYLEAMTAYHQLGHRLPLDFYDTLNGWASSWKTPYPLWAAVYRFYLFYEPTRLLPLVERMDRASAQSLLDSWLENPPSVLLLSPKIQVALAHGDTERLWRLMEHARKLSPESLVHLASAIPESAKLVLADRLMGETLDAPSIQALKTLVGNDEYRLEQALRKAPSSERDLIVLSIDDSLGLRSIQSIAWKLFIEERSEFHQEVKAIRYEKNLKSTRMQARIAEFLNGGNVASELLSDMSAAKRQAMAEWVEDVGFLR